MKKKILALLCIVSVIASAAFVDFPTVTKATEVEAAITAEIGELTKITLADTTKATDGGARMYAPGFKNTLMSFYVTLSGSGVRIHFGGRDAKSREGFCLLFWGDTMEISNAGYSGDSANKLTYTKETINASDFDLDTFFNKKLLLQLQTEFLTLDGNGTENDIRLKFYINKKLAATIEVMNETSKLNNIIRFCDGTFKTADYEDITDFERWTFSEMGGTDGTITASTGTHAIGGSLDQTYFQAKMTFPSGGFGQFFLGTGSYYGILLTDGTSGEDESITVQIVSSHNSSQQWGVTVGTITEAIAGELRNKELNIGISVRFVDVNTSNKTGNLIIGIWLDGQLYNDTLFVTKGAVRGSVAVTETRLSDFTKRVHLESSPKVTITSVASPKQRKVPDDFTRYTLSDINPQYNSGQIQGAIPGTTLDKVLYSARMTYTQASGQFHYAADSNSYGGFTLYPGSERKTLNYARVAGSIPSFSTITISATDAIGQEAFDTSFGLQITTEYVDADFDGNKDDVKLGLWFNRALYRNQYFYHIDAQPVVGMRVITNESGAPGMEDFHDQLPTYVNDYTDWSFEQATFKTGTHKGNWFGVTKNLIGELLDETIFHGYVTLDGTKQRIFIGHTSTYQAAVGFVSQNGVIKFGTTTGTDVLSVVDTFTPDECGLTSFTGEKVKLSLATKFIKVVSGTEADPKIEIEAIPLINGELVKGKKYTLTVSGKHFFRKVSVGSDGTLITENAACNSKIDDLPKGLTTVHMNDLGLADKVENWTSGSTVYYEKGSFDDTIIPFKITYGNSTPIIRWGQTTSSTYSGVGLNWTGSTLQVGGNSGTSALNVSALKVDVTPEQGFASKEADIKIVIQYMDMDYDGQDDDLKYGVYVNGKLAGGTFMYALDAVQYLGSGIGLQNGNIPSITTGGYTEKTLDESKYTSYTLADVGIKDGIGNAYGKLRDANGVELKTTGFDKVLFGAKVKFNKVASRMHYLAMASSQFSGMQIRLLEDGNIVVEDYSGKNLTYDTITVNAADHLTSGTFKGQEILVQWTTDIRDVDCEGSANDVLVGLWINGKLVNNRYIVMRNAIEALDCYVNFNEGSDTEFYSLWDIPAPSDEGTRYYKLTDENPYLVVADKLTDKDGTEIVNGEAVAVSGDYTATYDAVDEFLQESTQNIVLWKEWDVSADGECDVKDLVALKRVQNNETLSTKAAQMAVAKLESGSSLNEYREYLVGASELSTDGIGTLQYQVDENNQLVMTIGSWLGPTTVSGFHPASGTYLSDYGLESNFLQKKYYDMIEELGINQITYVGASDDYNSASYRTILKGLSMAEEYGLQVYVDDSAIVDDITDTENKTAAQIVAERANAYGRYASFAGYHVYDEPETDNFYYTKGSMKSVDTIKNKTSLLNSYANLSGFVNLYPDWHSYRNGTYYTSEYLPQYINKCNPKYLAFDDYPFVTGSDISETVESCKYYFSNLKQISNKAKAVGIPFVGFIGTGENYSQVPKATSSVYPTAEQLKWNVNTMLAYGAKGFNWFTLIEQWDMALTIKEGTASEIGGIEEGRCGLIGAKGNKTRHYDTAKAINNWVSKIDHILMEATNEKILATGTYAKNNTVVGESSYKGMTVSAENTVYGAIVGVFNYKGKTAYYVVNNYVKIGTDGTNKGAASQKITLDFGSTSKTCTVYNGATLGSTVTGTSCVLDIEAGGAALVIVD